MEVRREVIIEVRREVIIEVRIVVVVNSEHRRRSEWHGVARVHQQLVQVLLLRSRLV